MKSYSDEDECWRAWADKAWREMLRVERPTRKRKRHRCPYCFHAVFNRAEALRAHINRKHEDQG